MISSRARCSRASRAKISNTSNQRGTKTREAKLITRKNGEAYALDLATDILDAVDCHLHAGYAGKEFLFSNGAFPRYIDSHVRPLKLVQQKLGLRGVNGASNARFERASGRMTRNEKPPELPGVYYVSDLVARAGFEPTTFGL